MEDDIFWRYIELHERISACFSWLLESVPDQHIQHGLVFSSKYDLHYFSLYVTSVTSHVFSCIRRFRPIKPYIFWKPITLDIGCRSPLSPPSPPHSQLKPCTAQYSPVQSSTAKYSPVQPSTVKYSQVQSSTVQYSPVHPSTAQNISPKNVPPRNSSSRVYLSWVHLLNLSSPVLLGIVISN